MMTHRVLIALLVLGSSGCGLFGLGTSCPNDGVPQGSVAYQGTLSGMNGQTTTGSILVYRVGGAYTLRVQALTAPNETGLQIVLNGSQGSLFNAQLSANCGSRNFSTGIVGSQLLTNTQIESTRVAPPLNVYGFAALTSTTPSN